MFLDASSSQIHKETQASFKSDMKNFRQNVKDSLTQAKDTRWVTWWAYQNKLGGIIIDFRMIHKIIDWVLILY